MAAWMPDDKQALGVANPVDLGVPDTQEPENDSLRTAMKAAVEEHDAANRALRRHLSELEGRPAVMVERMLAGEHPSEVLQKMGADLIRSAYSQALQRFENSRREVRGLLILWAKLVHGNSYRSMGPRLGISEQLAVRLGQEAARRHPRSETPEPPLRDAPGG
jgi:hypothetical protein